MAGRSTQSLGVILSVQRPAFLTAFLVMWPSAVYADGGYGSVFLAFYVCGIVAFVLGAIASAKSVRPMTRRWAVGCTLLLVWLGLLAVGDNHESIVDLMFRMALFMALIMPIPFVVAFGGGLLVRHLLGRKAANTE